MSLKEMSQTHSGCRVEISQQPLGIFENCKNLDHPQAQDHLLSTIYNLLPKNEMH